MPYDRRLKRISTTLTATQSSALGPRLLKSLGRHAPLVSTAQTFEMHNLMTAGAVLFGWGRHVTIVGLRMIRRPSSSRSTSGLYNTR